MIQYHFIHVFLSSMWSLNSTMHHKGESQTNFYAQNLKVNNTLESDWFSF